MSTTEQSEAVAELRSIVRPGDEVNTILRHVSASGMMRHISLLKGTRNLDLLVSRAGVGEGYKLKYDGIKVSGCGMDMGFSLVYDLSALLYGYGSKRGYPCLGDRCPSNEHVNDRSAPRGRGLGIRHRDGYALRQHWL